LLGCLIGSAQVDEPQVAESSVEYRSRVLMGDSTRSSYVVVLGPTSPDLTGLVQQRVSCTTLSMSLHCHPVPQVLGGEPLALVAWPASRRGSTVGGFGATIAGSASHLGMWAPRVAFTVRHPSPCIADV
jgi:hypothetical protein